MRRIVWALVIVAVIATGTAVRGQTTDPWATLWRVLAFMQAEIEYLYSQVSGANALRVLDSQGTVVGRYILSDADPAGREYVALETNAELVVAPVGPAGFKEYSGTVTFWHTTTDCSGERYMVDGTDTFWRFPAQVRGNGVASTTGAIETLTFFSNEQFSLGSDLITGSGGFCDPGGPHTRLARKAIVIDISSFVPPFAVK